MSLAGVPPGDTDAQSGDNHPMDRTVTRIRPRDQAAADLAFWLSLPMAERVAAVEVLRRQAFAVQPVDHAEPRLQRVCCVTQRQRG